ncbi:MAG: cation:dicarboxylase symporter family transporter, partial [Isosphaeraceae bacterium]|nr:cation:dicarboxylase symporter family transporter [Isosphaeraceae bacterium]
MSRPETDAELIPQPADEPESRPGGLPLYVWVIGAVVLAIPVGLALGADASWAQRAPGPAVALLRGLAIGLDLAPKLIIRALGALAAPLVVLAILSAIVTNDLHGRQGARMMLYYLINTIVAMVFGLVLSNLIQPGTGAPLAQMEGPASAGPARLIDILVPEPTGPPKAPPPKSQTEILLEL